MKNHIKNYIKIMGLAAVLFGTAQATDYEISVTQEYKCDPNDPKSEKDGAMHFRISVKGFDNRFRGNSLRTVEIVWPVKQNHPNPIRVPGLVMQGIMQCGEGDVEWFEIYPTRKSMVDLAKGKAGNDAWAEYWIASLMHIRNWAEFYDPGEFSDKDLHNMFVTINPYVRDPYGEEYEGGPLFGARHIRSILDSFHRKSSDAERSYFERYNKASEKDGFSNSHSKIPDLEKKYREKDRHFRYGKPEGSFCVQRDGCMCVRYYFYPDMMFYLIKDPKRIFSASEYKLVIEIYGEILEEEDKGLCEELLLGGGSTCVWLTSDVPTCCFGIFKGLYSDNEIKDEKFVNTLTYGPVAGVGAVDVFEKCWWRAGSFFASQGFGNVENKDREGRQGRYQFVVDIGDNKDIREVKLDNFYPLKHGKDSYWKKKVDDGGFF